MDLTQKKCKPCEGGVDKLEPAAVNDYNSQLKMPWEVVDGMKITKTFTFPEFTACMDFANKVADLAEEEGHHPVMHIYFSKVDIELWTHAILGLSENDFIMAAKIEEL
ncbi:MAG TPA: 4a-hydroxytetrahydrobiopterin dehydratase [Bacteroidales bacterium]|nr:4a-hydroxytetrahydrobiopterin dehydratase [Bacteroidales bacterium]